MVPQSNISRSSPIVFVTVGTTQFKFERLFRAIDQVLLDMNHDFDLVVQTTDDDYTWQYPRTHIYKDIAPFDMTNLFKKAEKIVTHGGYGTMYSITENSLIMPFIVARDQIYQEHVDNHQKYFLDFIKKQIPKNYRTNLFTEGNLQNEIMRYLEKKEQPNILDRFVFHTEKKQKVLTRFENNLNKITR